MSSLDIKRVAIIGAGPAGICAAKHLLHNKYNDTKFDYVVFERRDKLGGIWVHNKEQIGKIPDEFISPMYKDLTTNIVKQAMQYPDFPVESSSDISYWHQTDFLKYLQDYAEHFGVTKFMQFHKEVTMISPTVKDGDVSEDGSDRFIKWNVESKDLVNGDKKVEVFDAVVLCNGVNSTPRYLNIKNLEHFKGETLHSKFFDDADVFKNKVVVMYGESASTLDIVMKIHKVATTIYIAKTSPGLYRGDYPGNVHVKSDIKEINEYGEIVFEDDSFVTADVLMFCTGYNLNYPLSPECKIKIEDNMLTPAYKHMFHAIYPSMVFLSLANFTETCRFYDYQCSYMLAIFTNTLKLPSQQSMIADIEKEIAKKDAIGKPRRRFHAMGFDTFDYANVYASMLKLPKYPEEIQKMYIVALKELLTDFYNASEKYGR